MAAIKSGCGEPSEPLAVGVDRRGALIDSDELSPHLGLGVLCSRLGSPILPLENAAPPEQRAQTCVILLTLRVAPAVAPSDGAVAPSDGTALLVGELKGMQNACAVGRVRLLECSELPPRLGKVAQDCGTWRTGARV